MNRATRKALNVLLADALRAQSLPTSGLTWEAARDMRDALIAQGVREKSACNKAAFRVRREAEGLGRIAEEGVTQAPTRVKVTPPMGMEEAAAKYAPKADARPKAMPAQAKRVQEGKVLRDAQGRILPAWVGEELAAING